MALLSFFRYKFPGFTFGSRWQVPVSENPLPQKKSEEIYNHLISEYFEDSGIGMLFLAEDMRVTGMNRAARVLLQRFHDAGDRPPMRDILPEAVAAVALECWKDKLNVYGRQVGLREGREKGKRALSVHALLLRDAEESYYGIALFLSASSQELGVAAQWQDPAMASEINRHKHLASIGIHAAGMAHEIKNPLVALKTFAELLPSKFDDAEFRQTFSKLALNEIRRIDSIVNDLLDYAKPRKPVFVKANPMDILQEAFAILAARIQECKIQVRQSDAKGMPAVLMDLEQMRRVFLNVMLNAVEAMPRGGDLTVTATLRQKAVPCVELCVADTGPGIPPMVLDKIFEPFYTTKKKGSGLGLAISKRIVEDHGGAIEFRSGTEGTICAITLPAAEAAEDQAMVAKTAEARRNA